MWGHPLGCGCPLCNCLGRIFYLIRLGHNRGNFANYALAGCRSLEAELRDEITRLAPPVSLPSVSAAPPAGASGEGSTSSQPGQGEGEPKGELHLTPKKAPPQPPNHLASEKCESFIAEPKEDPPKKVSPKKEEEKEKKEEEPKERARSSGGGHRR